MCLQAIPALVGAAAKAGPAIASGFGKFASSGAGKALLPFGQTLLGNATAPDQKEQIIPTQTGSADGLAAIASAPQNDPLAALMMRPASAPPPAGIDPALMRLYGSSGMYNPNYGGRA